MKLKCIHHSIAHLQMCVWSLLNFFRIFFQTTISERFVEVEWNTVCKFEIRNNKLSILSNMWLLVFITYCKDNFSKLAQQCQKCYKMQLKICMFTDILLLSLEWDLANKPFTNRPSYVLPILNVSRQLWPNAFKSLHERKCSD